MSHLLVDKKAAVMSLPHCNPIRKGLGISSSINPNEAVSRTFSLYSDPKQEDEETVSYTHLTLPTMAVV